VHTVQSDNSTNKKRIATVISLLVIVPIGFYGKCGCFGPATEWVNDSLGGVFYEIFWCLLLFLVFTNGSPKIIATSVLTTTCLLECLQLWHPPFLETIRSHFIGRTILGTAFVWSDFPYYFLGSWIGYHWISRLNKFGKRV